MKQCENENSSSIDECDICYMKAIEKGLIGGAKKKASSKKKKVVKKKSVTKKKPASKKKPAVKKKPASKKKPKKKSVPLPTPSVSAPPAPPKEAPKEFPKGKKGISRLENKLIIGSDPYRRFGRFADDDFGFQRQRQQPQVIERQQPRVIERIIEKTVPGERRDRDRSRSIEEIQEFNFDGPIKKEKSASAVVKEGIRAQGSKLNKVKEKIKNLNHEYQANNMIIKEPLATNVEKNRATRRNSKILKDMQKLKDKIIEYQNQENKLFGLIGEIEAIDEENEFIKESEKVETKKEKPVGRPPKLTKEKVKIAEKRPVGRPPKLVKEESMISEKRPVGRPPKPAEEKAKIAEEKAKISEEKKKAAIEKKRIAEEDKRMKMIEAQEKIKTGITPEVSEEVLEFESDTEQEQEQEPKIDDEDDLSDLNIEELDPLEAMEGRPAGIYLGKGKYYRGKEDEVKLIILTRFGRKLLKKHTDYNNIIKNKKTTKKDLIKTVREQEKLMKQMNRVKKEIPILSKKLIKY